MQSTASIASLLDFVAREARARTNICTRQAWESPYTLRQRTVPDYNVIFVTRGRVVWRIEDVAHDLTPGRMVFVPPHVPHSGYSRTREMTLLSIHVELLLPGGRDAYELLIPRREMDVPANSALDRYLRGALVEFDRADEMQTRRMLPGWGQLIAMELLYHSGREGTLRANPLTPLVFEVLEYLNQHADQDVTLEALSRFAGYTPQYINRLFQRELGTTPLKQLTAIRVERAKSLLEEGRLTIAAIARRCGYTDPAYFSRVFHKAAGIAPATYQRARGSESPSKGSPLASSALSTRS